MKRRIISILLCLAMLISLMPSVMAANVGDFTDMPKEGHWSYRALCAAIDNGLLQGSKGRLNPTDPLTRAQMAAVINRAFGAQAMADISEFTDVPQTKWYRNDIAKAVRMGTLNGYGKGLMMPDLPITREQAFTVIARALKLENGDAAVLNRFTDRSALANYAVGPVAAMVQNGYVNGSGGKINPKSSITRAEFAQVFYNVLKKYYKQAGEYTESVTGNAIVNVPGVTLKNMTIDGDLIVGEGVADGEIILDNTVVTGRVVVRGGGEHSVILRNSSSVGSMLVGKTADGGIRIRTEEGCRIEVLKVDDGSDDIILEGEFNQVAIATDAPIVLNNADITGLTISAKNAEVSLKGETSVSSVQVAASAEGASIAVPEGTEIASVVSKAEQVSVHGEGTVKTAEISGSNTVVDTTGTALHVEEGTEGVTQNGNAVEGGTSVETGTEPGEDPPQPHTHSWDTGTVTTAPSCEGTGVRTYRCACGESKTEEIPPLGHDWDDGEVTKEATAESEGIITFHCKREGCGATRTETFTQKPYCIVLNSGEPDAQELWFETLEEAIAEAGKHPYHNEPGEDPWTEYEGITLYGAAVINDLVLPAGYSLFVCGNLTLNGTMTLGSSDYAYCPGMGAARIIIPMFDETSVTVNGALLYDHNKDSGIISSVDTEENSDSFHMDVVTIYGTRAVSKAEDDEDATVYELPWLNFGGFEGRQCYKINHDYNFKTEFWGVTVGDTVAYVDVCADITLGDFEAWGDSCILLQDAGKDSGSVAIHGVKMVGYTQDCAIQLSSKAAPNTPGFAASNGEYTMFMGSDLTFTRDISIGNLIVNPYIGDPNTYTVTIPKGVSVELNECNFNEAVQVVNNGTLNVMNNVNVNGSLINNGTLNIYSDMNLSDLTNNGTLNVTAKETENPGEYTDGRLHFNDGELVNNGTLNVNVIASEEYHAGELNLNNATLTNTAQGTVNNANRLNANGSSIINRGTFLNSGNVDVNCGGESWVCYGEDAEAVQEGSVHEVQLVNTGMLRNTGNLNISGAAIENSGRITNLGYFEVNTMVNVKEIYELESIDGEPQDDYEWMNFWCWDESKWGDNTCGYWAIRKCDREVVGMTATTVENRGTLLNQGYLHLSNTALTNASGAELLNECDFDFSEDDGSGFVEYWRSYVGWEADLGEFTMPESSFLNQGTFVNGTVTGIGEEYSGSDAYCGMDCMEFTNEGSVTNNGFLRMNYVNYEQAAAAKLETYNFAGMEVLGGSMTIPGGSFFKNEGYMKICDQFGLENGVCDLSGFEDFFTTWNIEGNDSNWCEFTVQVFTEDGYFEAVERQNSLPETMRYNRLDFCDDITFTRNVTLDGFGSYWLQTKNTQCWQVWNNETMRWDVAEEGTPDAQWVDRPAGTTLTVAKGVTMTIASNNNLYVDGDNWDLEEFFPCRLVVEGTLVTEPGIEETEENGWYHEDPGRVEIWGFGSFDASRGTVKNNGFFEVRDYDFGHREHLDDGSFLYVHEGNLMRPAVCTVAGEPKNTVYAAEVRSQQGLQKAGKSERYSRILIRENCCITLTENLSISSSVTNGIDIEPGSGLIVEWGKTLRIAEGVWVNNNGDVSIYGDLILDGEFYNYQNCEVGAISGNEKAAVTVNGGFFNWNNLNCYETGSFIIGSGGRIENWNGEQLTTAFAKDAQPGENLRGLRFENEVVLRSASEDVRYRFEDCKFEKGVRIVYSGTDGNLEVDFSNQCVADGGVRILAENVSDRTQMNERIFVNGAAGMEITAECPANVSSESNLTLNGIYAEKTSEWGNYSLWVREEVDGEGNLFRVFQVDADDVCDVKLTGTLDGKYHELRLQQGGMDISELGVSEDTNIRIGDEFQRTRVNIGSKHVELDDFAFPDSCGAEIIADEGAQLTIYNAQMRYRGDGYQCTNVDLICGEKSYHIDPHIYGAVEGNEPGVYVGIGDASAEYTLVKDGETIAFDKELLEDGDSYKTHLNRPVGGVWFEAGQEQNPYVQLTIRLPGNITVIVDPIPVKPE